MIDHHEQTCWVVDVDDNGLQIKLVVGGVRKIEDPC